MRGDGRHFFSSSSALVLLTFLESFYVTIAESCSYSCLSNEDCCSLRGCCPSRNDYYYGVYDLWYFWFCICFGIFICSLAGGSYYRKRQLHTVRVAAIPAGPHGAPHGGPHAGPVGGMHGPYVRGAHHTHHAPPPRNVFVAATSASGQPMYPIGMYGVPPPNYPVYNTGYGGPVYPAYACHMPPPPAYNTLETGHHSEASDSTPGTLATAAPPTRGGQDAASYPEVGPPVVSS